MNKSTQKKNNKKKINTLTPKQDRGYCKTNFSLVLSKVCNPANHRPPDIYEICTLLSYSKVDYHLNATSTGQKKKTHVSISSLCATISTFRLVFVCAVTRHLGIASSLLNSLSYTFTHNIRKPDPISQQANRQTT